ncbi:MAG: ABC transporter permease [Limnochordia bacterium]|jgi:oligopeptide transport system permease protein
MGRYLGQKLVTSILVLWMIINLTFLLMHLIPGGPFTTEKVLPEAIRRNIERHYQLDAPWPQQYFGYLGKIVTFDLGPSYHYTGRAVNDIIRDGFAVSAVLGLQGLLLALILGIGLGILGACFPNSSLDGLILAFSSLGVAIPSFITASLLIYIFAYQLGWFPPAMWGGLGHRILPSLALAILPASYIAQLLRASILATLTEDYITAAWAKGLSPLRVLFGHALKNSILPLLAYLGPLTAQILTGSFVIEEIFAIPGLGRHFVASIYNRDYPVIMGVTIFYSLVLVAGNLLCDLLYHYADPRLNMD